MTFLKPDFKSSATGLARAIPLIMLTALSAQADTPNKNESFKVDENGIATCDLNGNARASRGLLSTQFANQFWSHLACAKWDRAYEILDEAPKMDMDKYPIPGLPEEIMTEFEKCYFNSFAYGGYNPYYHKRNKEIDGSVTVKHGFYRLNEDKFADIEAAAAYACNSGF